MGENYGDDKVVETTSIADNNAEAIHDAKLRHPATPKPKERTVKTTISPAVPNTPSSNVRPLNGGR